MVFPSGPIKVRDLIGGALMVKRKLSSFRRHKILSGIKDLRNDRKSKMELISIFGCIAPKHARILEDILSFSCLFENLLQFVCFLSLA